MKQFGNNTKKKNKLIKKDQELQSTNLNGWYCKILDQFLLVYFELIHQ